MPETRRWTVLLFAGLREGFGDARVVVAAGQGADVRALREGLAALVPTHRALIMRSRVAIDGHFVDDHVALPIDDAIEIAVIPPVSGGHDGAPVDTGVPAGADPVARCALTPHPIDPAIVAAAASHPGAGACLTFVGMVRARSRGRDVTLLEYEAYAPMAVRALERIADDLEREHEGARVLIHHRTGTLTVGEIAVVIAVSAPHRDAVYAASRAAIERLKQDVPIWKREVSPDGAEWIESGA